MPDDTALAKAQLIEVVLGDGERSTEATEKQPVDVQFNPESLKVTYANTVENGQSPGTAAMQYVAKSSTKLDLELWFDASVDPERNDVRGMTAAVKHFISPAEREVEGEPAFLIPALRFQWGSFVFDGVLTSLNETLDFFSAEGRPLRAKLAVSMTSQDIQFRIKAIEQSQNAGPGRSPRPSPGAGETLQGLAGRLGDPRRWAELAEANDIENPRLPPVGALLRRPERRVLP